MAFSEPILPRAFAAFLRTSESESLRSGINPSMAFSEPILPTASAAL